MSNEHPDMSGSLVDEPFYCERCHKVVSEDKAYGTDANEELMFCSQVCVSEWLEGQLANANTKLLNRKMKDEQMARELLSLRTGEGDEEVRNLYEAVFNRGIYSVTTEERVETAEQLAKLRDIAIARGQQLREAKRREQIMAHHCQKYVEMTWEQAEAAYDAAEPVEISREEIDRIVGLVLAMNDEELEEKDLRQQLREAQAEVEKWRKRAEWLGSCYKDKTVANGRIVIVLDGTKSATYPDDADTIANLMDNAMKEGGDLSEGLQTSKQQITALTAERDSLKEELDKARETYRLLLESNGETEEFSDKGWARVKELESQLAAMQSASEEEVDALVRQLMSELESIKGIQDYLDAKNLLVELTDLARTFYSQIAERDRLLNALWSFGSVKNLVNSMPKYKPFARILEIVAASDAESESEVGT